MKALVLFARNANSGVGSNLGKQGMGAFLVSSLGEKKSGLAQ